MIAGEPAYKAAEATGDGDPSADASQKSKRTSRAGGEGPYADALLLTLDHLLRSNRDKDVLAGLVLWKLIEKGNVF